MIPFRGANSNEIYMSWTLNLILSNEAMAAISSSALKIFDIGHSMFDCPEQTQTSPKRMSSITSSGWPSWLTRISQIWPSVIGSRMTDQALLTYNKIYAILKKVCTNKIQKIHWKHLEGYTEYLQSIFWCLREYRLSNIVN